MARGVLVVEDEEVIREDISSHLEDCGLTVFRAADAPQAIGKIMDHPQIALVFTNLRMPGQLDGRDLVLWLKLNRPGIVVMIATGGLARVETMKGLPVACAFLKPYKPQAVSDTILKALERRMGR